MNTLSFFLLFDITVLLQILAPDPKIRMKIPEIIQHPWFQEKLDPCLISRNSTMEATKKPLQTLETIQEIIFQACKESKKDVTCDLLNEVLSEIG